MHLTGRKGHAGWTSGKGKEWQGQVPLGGDPAGTPGAHPGQPGHVLPEQRVLPPACMHAMPAAPPFAAAPLLAWSASEQVTSTPGQHIIYSLCTQCIVW